MHHVSDFTNNLRLCYIELFEAGEIGNMAEFAERCGIPHNTMGRYLVKGVCPRNPARIRDIESRLEKGDGYLLSKQKRVDFDAKAMSWGQPKQRGVRKHHRWETDDVGSYVAEDASDAITRFLAYSLEEQRELLLAIRRELREQIGRPGLAECPVLMELGFGY